MMRWGSRRIYSLVLVGLAFSGSQIFFVSAGRADESFGVASSERFGEFQWLSPWIESGISYEEGREGNLNLYGASFGGRWRLGLSGEMGSFGQNPEFIEAQVSLGTSSLIGRPRMYIRDTTTNEGSDFKPVITESFVGISGSLGRLRIGYLPLMFGLESGNESERFWTRSLIVRRGLIGLRDMGIHYSVSSGGFYSDWFVHNGEGGTDLDHEIWMTGRWEYRLRQRKSQWRFGFSGKTGRTTPASTDDLVASPDPLQVMDPKRPSRFRLASLYTASNWLVGAGDRGDENDRRFGFELEAFSGDIEQSDEPRHIQSLRFDLYWEPENYWALFLRGEAFDPDTLASNDMLHEATFGLQYYFLKGSKKRSLRGLLLVTKEILEGRDIDQHRVELRLRFSPDLLD